MTEIWKTILEYPNYQISNFGNMKNIKTERILKGSADGNGYLFVKLSKKDEPIKILKIHRLVCKYFIENFNPDLDCDHIDRNRQNNNISNLRNVSKSENLRNKSKKTGCSSIYKGVSFFKQTEKWQASVSDLNGKRIHLGLFATELEASQKYQSWNLEKGFLV